jgi:predicted DNA-binding transcriptional regulator AlpA
MLNKKSFPETGFLRLPQILEIIPISKSTWWLGVKTGRFPKPTKLGKKISAWRVEEIKALIEKFPNPNK